MPKYVIDSFSPLDPARVKQGGYAGMFRYVAPDNSKTRPKILTPEQAKAIRAQGLDLVVNFEWYEDRAFEGYGAGVTDARTADAVADRCGYPRTCAIYYSVDVGVPASKVGAVLEYFRGVRDASKRPVGYYGGTIAGHPVLDHGYATFLWQANAGSWSGFGSYAAMRRADSKRAHVAQHVHADTPLHIPGIADTQFDPNTVLQADYGQWGSGVVIKPPEEEEPVYLIRIKTGEVNAGATDITDGKTKRHIASPTDLDLLVWNRAVNGEKPFVTIEVTKAQYDSIPNEATGTAKAAVIDYDKLATAIGAKLGTDAIATAVADQLAARLKA